MPRDCYLHGYVSSGIMKQVRENPESGLAITIAATRVDGIVLSLTPNSHSYNYRSAVLFGYGSLVDDMQEKLWAMEMITNSVVPGRWYVFFKVSFLIRYRTLIVRQVSGARSIVLLSGRAFRRNSCPEERILTPKSLTGIKQGRRPTKLRWHRRRS